MQRGRIRDGIALTRELTVRAGEAIRIGEVDDAVRLAEVLVEVGGGAARVAPAAVPADGVGVPCYAAVAGLSI